MNGSRARGRLRVVPSPGRPVEREVVAGPPRLATVGGTTDEPAPRPVRLEALVDGEPRRWREVTEAVRDGRIDVDRTQVRLVPAMEPPPR